MNRDIDEAIKEIQRSIAYKDYYIKETRETVKKSVIYIAKNIVKDTH
jgi:hypothetical protein